MTKISLEQGKTKIVACSLEWPGWCRFGKMQETALTALLDSAPRYRVIAERAGVDVAPEAFIVERVGGDATTDWRCFKMRELLTKRFLINLPFSKNRFNYSAERWRN